MAVYLVKVATFQSFSALDVTLVLKGLLAGITLMAGSFIARAIVQRIAPASHRLLIDGLMVFSGLAMIYIAVR